jgi:hypothetical protein
MAPAVAAQSVGGDKTSGIKKATTVLRGMATAARGGAAAGHAASSASRTSGPPRKSAFAVGEAASSSTTAAGAAGRLGPRPSDGSEQGGNTTFGKLAGILAKKK